MVGTGFHHTVNVDDILAEFIHVLKHNTATALFSLPQEQDVECAAHRRHLDLHLVILGQNDSHVTVDEQVSRTAHDDLTTQQFGHQVLGVIMVLGDVIDDVLLDALQCPLAAALDGGKLFFIGLLEQILFWSLGSGLNVPFIFGLCALNHPAEDARPLWGFLHPGMILGSGFTHALVHRRLKIIPIAVIGLIDHDVTFTRVGNAHQLIGKMAYGLEPAS